MCCWFLVLFGNETFSHFTIGRLVWKRWQCAPVFVCVLALCSNVYDVEERNLSFPTLIYTSIRHRIQRTHHRYRKYCLATARHIHIYVRFAIARFENGWFGKNMFCVLLGCDYVHARLLHTPIHTRPTTRVTILYSHTSKKSIDFPFTMIQNSRRTQTTTPKFMVLCYRKNTHKNIIYSVDTLSSLPYIQSYIKSEGLVAETITLRYSNLLKAIQFEACTISKSINWYAVWFWMQFHFKRGHKRFRVAYCHSDNRQLVKMGKRSSQKKTKLANLIKWALQMSNFLYMTARFSLGRKKNLTYSINNGVSCFII